MITTRTRTSSRAALALLVIVTLLGASGCRMILHNEKKSPDRWDKKRVDRAKALKLWESYKGERDSHVKGKRWASLVSMHTSSSSWKRLLSGEREFLPLGSLEDHQIKAVTMGFDHAGELAAEGKWRDLGAMTRSAKTMKYADGGSLDTGEVMIKSMRREADKRFLSGEKKNWQGAADAFGGAVLKLGDTIDAKLRGDLTKQARSYRKAQILEMERLADDRIKARDYDPARKAYEQAISYYKAPADKRQAELYKDLMSQEEAARLDRKLAEVTLTQSRDLIAQGKALQDKGRHREGLQKHDEALSLLPQSAEVKQARNASATRWITALTGQASKLESAHPGHALLLYAKAAALGDRSAQSKRDGLRRSLLARYTYKVAVNGSGPGGAMSSLESAKRQPFDAQIQVVSGGAADATITVTVGNASDRKSTSTSSGSDKYKSGTKQRPNPKIKDLEGDIKSKQRKIDDIRRNQIPARQRAKAQQEKLARTTKIKNTVSGHLRSAQNEQKRIDGYNKEINDLQRDISNIQTKIASTPRTISEDVFSTHTYTITTHTLTVSAPYSASVQHSDGRSALNERKSLSTSESDTTHPAQPRINKGADPLNLPSAASLTSRVYGQTGAATRAVIMGSLRSRQDALLQQGKRASGSARLDAYVLYLLLDPSTDDKPVAQDILKATDIDGARALVK